MFAESSWATIADGAWGAVAVSGVRVAAIGSAAVGAGMSDCRAAITSSSAGSAIAFAGDENEVVLSPITGSETDAIAGAASVCPAVGVSDSGD